MARLAIKGHPKRGEEVIKLLKMLGGHESGYPSNARSGYWVLDGCLNIEAYSEIPEHLINDFKIFTLEEFLKKYPYKTRDRVTVEGTECFIEDLIWHDELNCVRYKISHKVGSLINGWYSVQSLQPHKEETVEEKIKVDIPKGYEFAGVDDNNQQVVFEKIKPQYPKTYEECCKILDETVYIAFDGLSLEEVKLYKPYIELMRCRNAYWKIAGEQMELGGAWKPELNSKKRKFALSNVGENISFEVYGEYNSILCFPTEEMRDAFFENYKELIEKCKELL